MTNHKNIVIDEKVAQYIDELLLKNESNEVKEMLKESLSLDHAEMQVPLSQGRFLQSIIRMKQAKHVLEIGTFKGVSAAFIAQALPADGKLITCDHDGRIWPLAEKFWKLVGVDEKIEKKHQKALEYFEQTVADSQYKDYFDIIFIDADKEHSEKYVQHAMHILKKGGVILIDNVLWSGEVAEEVPQSNAGKYIKQFNEAMFASYSKQVSLVPAWDGLMMIVKE